MCKHAKARRKKWFHARIKKQKRAQRKEKFEKDFRACFVRAGILSDD